MPELPDIVVYLEALAPRVLGQPLERLVVGDPFVLRSVFPPPADLEGRRVETLERIGKRIVLGLEGDRFIVIHLMITGRLRWAARLSAGPPARLSARPPARPRSLASFTFPTGTLLLTEAGSRRRAAIHLTEGRAGLVAFDRGGLEVMGASLGDFAARVRLENHTLKRALTDPRLLSGIGNAYSDEILHRARLSPLQLTRHLDDEAMARLHRAVHVTLADWTARLRADTGDGFPEKVTAFRDGMAVHGRFRQPCPVCGAPVQRIRYAENETNYCARCQTGGRVLADRSLSRLLRNDWPRSIDELE
ncbi:MAG: Fpg/Nei family DNA glycosylase [Gemmatimonadales bacterium]